MSAAAAGIGKATANVEKVLRSPALWIALALLLTWLIYRNGSRWLDQVTHRDLGNYEGQEAVTANPAREAQLQQMATDAFEAIQGIPGTGREDGLLPLTFLNDTELRYVAQFYENSLNPSGVSLSQDLQDEWGLGDTGDKLISRLNQMAL